MRSEPDLMVHSNSPKVVFLKCQHLLKTETIREVVMVKIEWGHQDVFTLCPLVQIFEWGHKATVPLQILDLSGGTCPHGPHYNYLTDIE